MQSTQALTPMRTPGPRSIRKNPSGKLLAGLLLAVAWIGVQPPAAQAVVRGSVHGLTPEQLRQLRQLPMRAILPGAMPKGYQLKEFQVSTGKEAGYQIDYRCFCSGANYTINLIGTTRPLKPAQAGSQRETILAKGLGAHLQLAQYPAGQGIAQAYYLSSWLSRPPLQVGVLSAFEGHSAPKQDLRIFMQGLVYLP